MWIIFKSVAVKDIGKFFMAGLLFLTCETLTTYVSTCTKTQSIAFVNNEGLNATQELCAIHFKLKFHDARTFCNTYDFRPITLENRAKEEALESIETQLFDE